MEDEEFEALLEAADLKRERDAEDWIERKQLDDV